MRSAEISSPKKPRLRTHGQSPSILNPWKVECDTRFNFVKGFDDSSLFRIWFLFHMLERKPNALSGGQRQRVALGRAIVRSPIVFLFDEPLSNLDAKMRVQMRSEISRLHAELGSTMIYVTHDQVEAMTMGDRICVMRDGLIMQVADPLILYRQPDNLFVAGFIGGPPMNLLKGKVQRRNGALFFTESADPSSFQSLGG
jgi:multiple sugar transport system ATP-binding protein